MFDIGSVIFFLSPIIDSYETYKGEKDIKNYPYMNIAIKLIASIILFSTYFIKNKYLNEIYLTILGFNGIILCLIFACFYYYFLYQKDMNNYLKYNIIIIFGTIISILIFGFFFIQIPFISQLLIFISYTSLTLSPFLDYKQILSTKDYKLINIIDLTLLFFMNLNLSIIFFSAQFTFINFVIQLNNIISLVGLIYYYYLYYQNYAQQKNNQMIDPNINNNKINEQLITPTPISLDNNLVNNPFNFNNNNNNTENNNNYQPPMINDDNPTNLV